MIDIRKNESILRCDSNDEIPKGIIRTDGLYISSNLIEKAERSNTVPGIIFFEDGSEMILTLIGNEIDKITHNLKGFDIKEIKASNWGLYRILSKDSVYEESYSQYMRYIYPNELLKDTFFIRDEKILFKSYPTEKMYTYVFVPCSIPITSHHPFKSKRFLWSDKKARKQYLREWKKIKKERKKSKIKYVYRE